VNNFDNPDFHPAFDATYFVFKMFGEYFGG
jgi:hypothetical protein